MSVVVCLSFTYTVLLVVLLLTHVLPCAASLAGIPPGGLGLSGLVHEKAHPSISKSI